MTLAAQPLRRYACGNRCRIVTILPRREDWTAIEHLAAARGKCRSQEPHLAAKAESASV